MITTVVRDLTGTWHRFKITDSIDPPVAKMYCNMLIPDDELMARLQFDSPKHTIKSQITNRESLWCHTCKLSIYEDANGT